MGRTCVWIWWTVHILNEVCRPLFIFFFSIEKSVSANGLFSDQTVPVFAMEKWHYMEKHFYIYKHIVLSVQIIDDLYLIIPYTFKGFFLSYINCFKSIVMLPVPVCVHMWTKKHKKGKWNPEGSYITNMTSHCVKPSHHCRTARSSSPGEPQARTLFSKEAPAPIPQSESPHLSSFFSVKGPVAMGYQVNMLFS